MRPLPLLVAALVLVPSAASAQIVVTVSGVTGRTTNFDLAALASVNMGPVTAAECGAGAEVTFNYNMVDSNRQTLQYFRGQNCDDPMVRTDLTTTICEEFDPARSTTIMGNTMVTDIVPVTELVNCDATDSGVENIWVLALDNANSTVTEAGQQAQFDIAYDFEGPRAPEDVMARTAEEATTVSWTGNTDQSSAFEIYVVPDGCMNGVVTTTVFDGDSPSISPSFTTDNGNTTQAEVAFTPVLEAGDEVAIAVRGIDIAGNVGELSTVICSDVVPVMSWWDTYCGGGTDGPCPDGNCSASPGRSSAPLGLLLMLGAVALFVRRRR